MPTGVKGIGEERPPESEEDADERRRKGERGGAQGREGEEDARALGELVRFRWWLDPWVGFEVGATG